MPSALMRLSTVLLLMTLGSGCSSLGEPSSGSRTDYQHSQNTQGLEVPPDLTLPPRDPNFVIPDPQTTPRDAASSAPEPSPQDAPAATVAQRVPGISLQRDGSVRWLSIDALPQAVWPKVLAFWQDQGFTLTRTDATLGIMETQWSENRADIPQDGLRKYIGRAFKHLYSTAMRDKFRARLEPQGNAGTALYMSHQGMQEVVQGQSTIWQTRPTDPELEAEMLVRLMTYLGAAPADAQGTHKTSTPTASVQLIGGNNPALELTSDLEPAWQRIGVALERAGYAIVQRDHSKNTYTITRGKDSSGLLSRLAFWRRADAAAPLTLRLTATGPRVRVTPHTAQGAPDRSKAALALLKSLQQTLQ